MEGVFPNRDKYAESVFEDGCISMVREDGYKFISTGIIDNKNENEQDKVFSPSFHKLTVFDLTSDPYEYVNLIDTQQGQEMLKWSVKKHKELRKKSPYLL